MNDARLRLPAHLTLSSVRVFGRVIARLAAGPELTLAQSELRPAAENAAAALVARARLCRTATWTLPRAASYSTKSFADNAYCPKRSIWKSAARFESTLPSTIVCTAPLASVSNR